MNPSSTIITGAGGHVGACLVRMLLDRGHTVAAIDLDANPPGLAGLDITLHQGDIRDAQFLKSVFSPGATLFHLASVISTTGDKGGLVSSVNVDGARIVAETALASNIKRMVHFSSIHAYDIDTHGTPVTENTRLATHNSHSAYNLSKARGQQAVLDVVKDGLDAVVVNPTGIIGPYDYRASRMGKFFRAVARGKIGKVGPGGFNWVDVRDVASGAISASDKGRRGQCYILGGNWATNVELGSICQRITGTKVPTKPIPMWLLEGIYFCAPLMAALGKRPPVTREALDALRANPDMSHNKATTELGYSPRHVHETLNDIFDWIQTEDILKKDRAQKATRTT